MESVVIRRDIEALRAFAVLIVVISHAKLGLGGGFIGVDVFFVISGFLITANLIKLLSKDSTKVLSEFYAKRFLRILPASVFVALIILIGSRFLLSKVRFVEYCWQAIASLLNVVNYKFALDGSNYFANISSISPFQHYWSLAVEAQYYFFWPILLIAIYRFCSIRKFKLDFVKVSSVILFAIIIISFVYNLRVSSESQPWAYFGFFARAWQLGVGSLIAINNKQFINLQFSRSLGWIGFVILLQSLLVINERSLYPGFLALLPVIGSSMVIIGGSSADKLYSFGKVFDNHITRFTAKISYSLYLIHWPLFVFYFYQVKLEVGIWNKLILIMIAFAMSTICYLAIEKPFRYDKNLRSSYKNSILFGLIITLFGLLFGVGMLVWENISLQPKVSPSQVQPAQQVLKLEDNVKTALTKTTLPENMLVPPERSPQDFNDICQDDWNSIAPKEKTKCSFVDNSKTKTIVLLGDSHAQQWLPPLLQFGKKYEYRIVVFVKSGCTMVDIPVTVGDGTAKRDYPECSKWRDSAINQIAELKPEYIITSQTYYPNNNSIQYKEYFKRIKQITNKVVRIQNTPLSQGLELPECILANRTDLQKCTYQFDESKADNDFADESRSIDKDLGVGFVRVYDWFCYEGKCPAIIDDIAAYKDSNHVTASYSNRLANVLEKRLIEAMK